MATGESTRCPRYGLDITPMFYRDVCPTREQRARDEGRQSEGNEPVEYETGEGMNIENELEQEMDRLAAPDIEDGSSSDDLTTTSTLITSLMSPRTISKRGGHLGFE
ncbi:hypothetical protein GB937_001210 [Aspergillus fischeri]|nr:hypothetical protein GB937_001210 [Aspergillus fischeri]